MKSKVLSTLGYKTEDSYVVVFKGENAKRLAELKDVFDVDDEQDVVRLAIRTIERINTGEF